jgi:hypothetical protein
MKYYGGSYRRALFHLYEKYWKNLDNHRTFLENFAKIHEFDPLEAKNWERISATQVEEIKVLLILGFLSLPSPFFLLLPN